MPIDDQTRDEERPVGPEPDRVTPPAGPDVPEGDALEQATEVAPGRQVHPPAQGVEVPEGDALEQAIEVPLDDDGEDTY
jgi:hypothetical protein